MKTLSIAVFLCIIFAGVSFVAYLNDTLNNGIVPDKVGDLRLPTDFFTLKLEELKNEFGDEK